MFCATCGSTLAAGATFCVNCGSEVQDSTQSTAAVQPTQTVATDTPSTDSKAEPEPIDSPASSKPLEEISDWRAWAVIGIHVVALVPMLTTFVVGGLVLNLVLTILTWTLVLIDNRETKNTGMFLASLSALFLPVVYLIMRTMKLKRSWLIAGISIALTLGSYVLPSLIGY
jgi:hypothetical protein